LQLHSGTEEKWGLFHSEGFILQPDNQGRHHHQLARGEVNSCKDPGGGLPGFGDQLQGLNHGCPGWAIGWELKFNLESPVSAALVAVAWVIDWLVSFTFACLGFLLAEEMKAELGQEIPCTQVFLISLVHLGQGHNQGPGMAA
jgi:hypothetical protein